MTALLGPFRVLEPADVDAAVAAWHGHSASRYLAGGTDLLVNLRRGLDDPVVLVDLRRVHELRELVCTQRGARIGATVTVATLASDPAFGTLYPAVCDAARSIAGPAHRNLATVAGNLCLDTRCIYYNQSEWWRQANGYCLKYRGDVCHVAPQGKHCHAAFCGDLAPALLVLAAEVEVAGRGGRRRLPVADLYREDGREHLTLAAGELLVAVHLPPDPPPSAYAKVRVRGSTDYPLAGVAVALRSERGRVVSLSVALTGTNSRPFRVEDTDALVGQALDAAALQHLGKLVQQQVRPTRTTLIQANYRRQAASALARRLAVSLAGVQETAT